MAEQPELPNPVGTEVAREQQTQDTQDALTDEEIDQLEQYKVEEGSAVWMMVGITGTGKSCLGNFILGQDNLFRESSKLLSETAKAALRSSSFDNENLCVIDTPGLGDTENLGSSTSDAEDAAYDYSTLATELTKVMMMTDQGINAFLIVVQANHRDFRGLNALLYFFDIIGDYWDHSILVVTHGKKLGKTEEEQYTEYREVLTSPKCPAPLKKLWDKVSGRLVIVEAKKWRDQPDYHRGVVGKIMKYSKEITDQHGPFKDDVQSIGRVAREKAKLELRNEFENFESSEAQKAIYQSIFKHVKGVIYKLVSIKLADGADVDKLKKMAELKEGELGEVRKLTDIIRNEYQEEKKKRKEAEEKTKEAEIRQIQAEERKRQAETERDSANVLRREADKNRVSAEQQKERADKDRRAAEQLRERADEDRRTAEQEKDSAEKNMAKAQREMQAADNKMRLAEQSLQIAQRDKSVSDQQRQEAERDMKEAKNQRDLAERNKASAIEQKNKAQTAMEKAENQRKNAERDRATAIEQKERAEADRTKAKKEQDEAEIGKRVAEENMKKAERDMNESKTQKNFAEQLLMDANSKWVKAEGDTKVALEQKRQAEKDKRNADDARKKAEQEAEYSYIGKRVAEQNMNRAERDMNESKTQKNFAEQLLMDANSKWVKAEQERNGYKETLRKESEKGFLKRAFGKRPKNPYD